MKPKSLKSTRSRLCAAIGGVALAGCLLWPSAAVHAQDPTVKPKTPKAFIRFWNMLPKTPDNNLMLLSGEQSPIASLPPSNIFADYVEAPAGSYTLIVRRLSDTTGALQRLPVALPDKAFITLLAYEKNGQPTVQAFNDTPDPKVVESYARIMLRQFFPGARVKVSVVGGPSSQPLEYGETAALENVPPNGQTNIVLQAVLPTTPPSNRTWTLTGDFSSARHATLLLVADSYGRFRPRLAYDGPSTSVPTAGATVSP